MNTPPNKPESGETNAFGLWEVTILVLSVYVLGALLAQTLIGVSPEVNGLLDRLDGGVCILFLTDFVVRFRRAPSKFQFMKWGWVDLISSIPAYDFLRWGRVMRVIRIIRVLRAFRSVRHIVVFLYRQRTRNLALSSGLLALILVVASSIAILAFEGAANSTIRTSFDALWWAVSTMTTVGYGDTVPVTPEGKVVAMVLMVTGVGLFGVLTGLFARLFVEPEIKKEDADIVKLMEEMRLLREQVEVIGKKLGTDRQVQGVSQKSDEVS